MDDKEAQLPPQTGVGTTVPIIPQHEPSGTEGTNPKLRKRTKTGCLTCRKRRIKCGEERPICNNCVKSKRHCEGYSQRVIFKPPIGDWPMPQSEGENTLLYHTGMLPGARSAHACPEHFQATEVPLTPLHPRPGPGSSFEAVPATDVHGAGSVEPFGTGGPFYGTSNFGPRGVAISRAQTLDTVSGLQSQGALPHFMPQWTSHESPVQYQHQVSAGSTLEWGARSTNDQAQFQALAPSYPRLPSHTVYQIAPQILQPQVFAPGHPIAYSEETPSTHLPRTAQTVDDYGRPLVKDEGNDVLADTDTRQRLGSHTSQPHYVLQQQQHQENESARRPTVSVPDQMLLQAPVTSQQVPSGRVSTVSAFTYGDATQLLEEAAVEIEDDDYYDVHSDEEMDDTIAGQSLLPTGGKQRDFGMILALHRASTSDISMRRYDTFIYEGILDSYRAEWVANPLRNPKTARVFAHFVHATGPALSIYERNPRNASAFFGESPMPSSQQSLWTYTMPMMALNHQGLLHVMLALASLHIARLQGASETPSYKHYAYALKRIHHCVGHPKKRHAVTTLAASLLLGHYEIMTADHIKWSSHLMGAKQLLLEIDFAGMTSEMRRAKAEQEAYERDFAYYNPEAALSQRDLAPLSQDVKTAVDEGLMSTLIGRKLRYDEHGRIVGESNPRRPSSSMPRQFDLSKYETLQDLFWWYVRHDAYYSIISGNPLLMDYSRWSDCPPRAGMGRRDAVYGTHDHIMLLLGRIAEFASRDRKRKLKALAANGGIWRPPPGMPGGPGPGAATARPPVGNPAAASPSSNQATSLQGSQGAPPRLQTQQMPPRPQQTPMGPPPQMPPFYGMAPTDSKPYMPSYYSTNKSHSPILPASSPQENEMDLAAATASALEEWNQIRAALHVFASHLGPDYQPLSAEYYQPLASPFGNALQYHSYDIGIIWALYYMCHIIHIRSHPSMPPAAMMAAGVAASQTAHLAQEIGRIAAGIMPTPQQNQPLNPSLGAAMAEITLPLFFAGVQYVDADQRAWLVSRVLDTDARTGWASTGMIARGCEAAWEKAASLGRGPPYHRYRNEEDNEDERISGRPGHLSDEPRDRRFIHVNAATRLHWAVGVLAEEEDIRSPEGT